MTGTFAHIGFLSLALLLSSCTEANQSRDTPPGVLRVAELNTAQIQALDRTQTVVFLQIGILEEHGPFLPSYADGYAVERMTAELAHVVAQRPGWNALVFPVIPLGQGGANEIGAQFSFPGSFTVRAETLRAVVMDFASAIGEQGFHWIFIIDMHGAPLHKRALDQAAAYFGDEYRGNMVNLFGLAELMLGDERATANLTNAQRAEDGFTVHAGMRETSEVFFLRPDLVASGLRQAPSVTGRDMAHLVELARRSDWPGYFGAPRFATAEAGARSWRVVVEKATSVMTAILQGADFHAMPRYADVLGADTVNVAIDRAAIGNASRLAERQRQWLVRNEIQ